MKKPLLVGLFVVTSLSAAPVLFEAYQEDDIRIQGPADSLRDTLTVIQISFSVDTSCYVQFATGGYAALANFGLILDEDSLPASLTVRAGGADGPVPMTYTYLVLPGEHTIGLQLGAWAPLASYTTCCEAYLQALLFLPDTSTNAVAEQPAGDSEPLNTPSLVSSGPYVNAAGATQLVDSSGRIIEDVISNDRVYINKLSQGTYFAREGEQTIVKIVKVE